MAGKNERQRRQARERHRRQQEQRLVRQRQVRKRWLIGLSAVLVAALVGSLLAVFLPGGKRQEAGRRGEQVAERLASATATATAVAEPAHHCSYTSATPAAKKVSLPPATPDYTDSYQATINTNQGKITFNLLNSKATCTVNSFVHLARGGLLQQHPVPPAGDQRHLRAAVRRSVRDRHRQAELQRDQQGRFRHAGLRFRQ